MKNKLLCNLMVILIILSLSACTVPEQNESTNSVDVDNAENPIALIEDYWHLACENTDVVLYKNLIGTQSLEFELVTAFPFEEDELTVAMESPNSNLSSSSSCYQDVQEEEEVFPLYLYQCYRGIDWKQMKELEEKINENDVENIEMIQKLTTMQSMYLDEYQAALEQGALPKLYRYVVGINFELEKIGSVEQISAITLTLRGETKRYALNTLILDAETELDFEGLDISMSYGIFDAPIYISNNGTLDLTYLDLQPQEQITLTGFSLYGEDSVDVVGSSVILIGGDGLETEMKWDGETPLQVLGGESIRVNVTCVDSKLAGVMEATTSKYILIHYKSADGKEYTECVQGIYRMRQGLYDLYAAADGANVLSYYLDYYSSDIGMFQAQAS